MAAGPSVGSPRGPRISPSSPKGSSQAAATVGEGSAAPGSNRYGARSIELQTPRIDEPVEWRSSKRFCSTRQECIRPGRPRRTKSRPSRQNPHSGVKNLVTAITSPFASLPQAAPVTAEVTTRSLREGDCARDFSSRRAGGRLGRLQYPRGTSHAISGNGALPIHRKGQPAASARGNRKDFDDPAPLFLSLKPARRGAQGRKHEKKKPLVRHPRQRRNRRRADRPTPSPHRGRRGCGRQ